MEKSPRIHLSLGTWLVLMAILGGLVWYFRPDPRDEELRRLSEALTRLESEHRVAEVVVVEQSPGPRGRLKTRLRFSEIRGKTPLPPRQFEIEGDVAYFDALVLKFERGFVREGDPLRGRSLHLFRRAFGEFQEPDKGFPLDPAAPEGVPLSYRASDSVSAFERDLWRDFWDVALHPEKAHARGVRVAHGEAIYTKLRPGRLYRLTIESAGGLSLQIEEAPSLAPPDPPRR